MIILISHQLTGVVKGGEMDTYSVSQQISLTVVELGENITLHCPVPEKEDKFYWYKQSLGHMAQTVAAVIVKQITITEQFKDPRFTVKKEEAQYLLTIRNVSKEDEATYFCQTGTTYSLTSGSDQNQEKHVYVKQSPETASVQLGDPMTLQCSLLSKNKETRVQCPGEHSVHWFRAGSGGSHPGIIYTQRNRSDEEEERSCVYSLSKTIQDSSDSGTYYCAVVTCGEILFGEGTKVETKCGSELDPVFLVLGVLLACCVTVIAILIFYINQRKVCKHCKGMFTIFSFQLCLSDPNLKV
uniref:Ig-like domain-containing protein n=1 Tax=Lates calcarifer TaxID=8187 RepID=A0A4W6FCG6_LATCA